MPRRDLALANAGLLGAVVIWGTMFPLITVLLRTWDVYSSSAARLISGAAILVLVLLARRGWRVFTGMHSWLRVWLLATIGVAVFNTMMTLGIALSGPISASIVATAGPVTAALMERVMYGTRLTREVMAATVLALAGGVCVAFARPGELGDFRGGEILIAVASATWLWYSMKIQDWFPGPEQARVTATTYVLGSALVVLFSFAATWLGVSPGMVDLSTPSIALVVAIGLSSTAMAVTFWLYGVARLGVTVGAVYGNLVPLVAVLSSAALGIAPKPLELVGGAIVIAGVVVVQFRARWT